MANKKLMWFRRKTRLTRVVLKSRPDPTGMAGTAGTPPTGRKKRIET